MEIDHSQALKESVLRDHCSTWLSSLFPDVPRGVTIESIISNAKLLGEIADFAESGALPAARHQSGHRFLDCRPFKDVIEDMQRFYQIQSKYVHPSNHLSLADVQARKSGTKACLCLWDIANGLTSKVSGVPVFASQEDLKKFNSIMPRQFVEERSSNYSVTLSSTVSEDYDLGQEEITSPVSKLVCNPAYSPSIAMRDEHAILAIKGTPKLLVDPLEAILSPEKLKPSHSRLLNSIMHFAEEEVKEEEDEGKLFSVKRMLRVDTVVDDTLGVKSTRGKLNNKRSGIPWLQSACFLVLGVIAGVVCTASSSGRRRPPVNYSPQYLWDSPGAALSAVGRELV